MKKKKECQVQLFPDLIYDFFLTLHAEQWENIVFKLNDSKRYRRTVGSIAGSCSMVVTPLLASGKQAACLVALDIVEVLICFSVDSSCGYGIPYRCFLKFYILESTYSKATTPFCMLFPDLEKEGIQYLSCFEFLGCLRWKIVGTLHPSQQ